MKDSETSQSKKTIIEKLTAWIAGVGSLVTIILTLYNAGIKSEIDKSEIRMKDVQTDIAKKSNNREDLKEKVARYTWIRNLFPDLINEKDEKKRKFTISLVRQILDEKEAEDLFTSLGASSNKELQDVGKSALKDIQNAQTAELIRKVGQINADTVEVRKRTVQMLIDNYKDSPNVIGMVIDLYDKSRIDQLSPSGIINGLVFLTATKTTVWRNDQLTAADDLIARLKKRDIGQQTKNTIGALEKHLAEVRSTPRE
jgi:predicted lactoylglutathione lyase